MAYLKESGKVYVSGVIRFRLAPRTCAPRGPSAHVVPDRLTKPRKMPTRKILPFFCLARAAAEGLDPDAPDPGREVHRVDAR